MNREQNICPNCGAENYNSGKCAYCGSQIGALKVNAHAVAQDNIDKSNEFLNCGYDKWDNINFVSQKKEYRVGYSTYLKLIKKTSSDERTTLYLYFKDSNCEGKFCHFETSSLYVSANSTVFKVKGAEKSNIDYDKDEESGFFEIDKNILYNICISDNPVIRIKSLGIQERGVVIKSKSEFMCFARIFYHLVYDNSSFGDAIAIVEKKKEESLRKQLENVKNTKDSGRKQGETKKQKKEREWKEEQAKRMKENGGCLNVLIGFFVVVLIAFSIL